MTKAAALASGEADWWENPAPDIWPVLAANPEITLAELDPLGSMGTLRFNHIHPPFDNAKMRQAVLAVADQVDFMVAYAGQAQNWKLCPSFFTCGTPMASTTGSEALTGKRDFDKAKRLIAEAGYKGEKIVVLDAVDTPVPHSHARVAADLLRKLGLNVEIAASDWGNLTVRRASKKPIDEGGWNVFGTSWFGADMLNPGLNQSLRTNGDAAWFGWPEDDKLEALRSQWMRTTDSEARQEIAAAIQERAFAVVPYIPTGQWKVMTAYRKNLKDPVLGPVIFQWGVEGLSSLHRAELRTATAARAWGLHGENPKARPCRRAAGGQAQGEAVALHLTASDGESGTLRRSIVFIRRAAPHNTVTPMTALDKGPLRQVQRRRPVPCRGFPD
jgi:peptide/nickel transport system substrate-binding protein